MSADEGQARKKIDESWKEAVESEKQSSGRGHEQDQERGRAAVPASFALIIVSMRMDCCMSLGEIEHPVTKEKKVDIARAKYLIDTLGILQTKTRQNLTADETELLESVLYELRMLYVTKSDPDKR